LASSTEKEVLKVVFKVSKEVSKVSECFKKNIVVSKRTLLFPKEHCCYEKLFVADFCVSFTQAVLKTPKFCPNLSKKSESTVHFSSFLVLRRKSLQSQLSA